MREKKPKTGTRSKKTSRTTNLVARVDHTAKLREFYAQTAEQSFRIYKEWQRLDYRLWEKLD